MQVNRLAALAQMVAVSLPQDHTATCRQDTLLMLRQIAYHLLLNVTKGFFALALKELADGATNTPFYDQV